MMRFRSARRGAVLTALATLLSVPAVTAGASAAFADAACIGMLRNSPASTKSIDWVLRGGQRFFDLQQGNSTYGNEGNPVIQFRIHSGDVARIDYTDMRTGKFLATHTNVVAGLYDKNICHIGVVTVT